MNYLCQIVFLLCLLCGVADAQKFTVSGYVKEAATGEVLLGAPVVIRELGKGVNTNSYGFYSITLDKGEYTLDVSYIGFKKFSKKIVLDKDLRLNIELEADAIVSQEVEIVGEKEDNNVKGTEMGTFTVQVDQIKNLPAFMGEVDILKVIQLLPGVQGAGDGNSGFYVRGGGPDQNLILLDEAVVYNASHLMGFFSVFNGDAVKDVTLVKGNMPANYGGRLSSVLDISMKEGNLKKFVFEGGIGNIASRFTIQGPIKKDTSSFIISGRRTYIDVLLQPFLDKDKPLAGTRYYFYDLNTKINYRLSDKDRIFLSGYFGRDKFIFKDKESDFETDIPWGNATGSLRWNHLFSDKLFMNTSAIFSNYTFEFGATQSQFEFRLFSGIRDLNGKLDFSWFPNVKHKVKFGANYIYHTFTPSNATARSGDVEFNLGDIVRLYSHEAAVYINDEWEVSDLFSINAGIRFSGFQQIGPFKRYIKDLQGKIMDSVEYKKGQKVADYGGLEPRISMRYIIDEHSSVKAGYTRNYQYIHLASLSGVSLPTDVWMPCTEVIKPQIGTQYSAGYFKNFKKNMYETSVEVYYKDMRNMIEYKEGTQPEDDVKDNPDNSFTFGDGWSYGAEFFIKKRFGKINGWIGYTLAWTMRQFDEINEGNEFPAKYDRRHDISVVLTYDYSPRWTFSTIWVFATGNTGTLPSSFYFIEGHLVNEYGPRNSYRFVPYHRLDVSATFTPDKVKRQQRRKVRAERRTVKKGKTFDAEKWTAKHQPWETSWTFALYNAYNRKNPYFIYFETSGSIYDGNLSMSAKQVSLFPILPSVTWNFKF
ncbi:MAG: TonB-dependent receptor [Bacteroidia bacterium]|nr:TonB-dependent receptor [Bacteroidia bacterium]